MSARDSGDHESDELIATEAGLERVLTALAADGDATELVGRQAALTMFRTVRDAQPGSAPSTPTSATASPGSPGPEAGRSPRAGRRPRVPRAPKTPRAARFPRVRQSSRLSFPALVATAAALVAVCAAATTAAYIAALPAPVQQIAHSVFAPLGIPTAPQSQPSSPGQGSGPALAAPAGTGQPGSSASGTPSGSSGPGASARPSSGVTSAPGASPTASASGSPTVSPTSASPSPGAPSLTLTAASAHVAPGGQDTFTAQLTQATQPLAQISVQLLEHDADVAGLRVAATGVTGADGTVTLTATGLTVNAVFHVAGTGQFSTVASPKVTVEVIPSLVVHATTATTLMVRAVAPAAPGDAVVLQQLSAGAWIDVTTRALGPQDRAAFAVVSGQTYRVALRATIIHGRAVSAPVKVA